VSIAGNILGKLKNLLRKDWVRVLKSEGLEDDCGNLTPDGRETVLRMLAEKAYNGPGETAGKTLRQEIGEGVLERNKQIKEENE